MKTEDAAERQQLFEKIMRALEKVHYGSVEITVHDSRVVQVEIREKIRVTRDLRGD